MSRLPLIAAEKADPVTALLAMMDSDGQVAVLAPPGACVRDAKSVASVSGGVEGGGHVLTPKGVCLGCGSRVRNREAVDVFDEVDVRERRVRIEADANHRTGDGPV